MMLTTIHIQRFENRGNPTISINVDGFSYSFDLNTKLELDLIRLFAGGPRAANGADIAVTKEELMGRKRG